MKTSTSGGKHEIQWTSAMQLDDLDFADDLALISQTQQQMQEAVTSIAEVSAAIGLNIHKGKSKVLRYNTACNNPITIGGVLEKPLQIWAACLSIWATCSCHLDISTRYLLLFVLIYHYVY
ncbi:unnamed protein product [Schistosoma curassoni]|uniref:Reverse transcriptase domain-containing protein n=1 Tax=Schistosoma curassoni TaxID=6186 RepID=A0A183KKT8_9TREM|nr:unnamed protein product [Schistosoma curassoni]